MPLASRMYQSFIWMAPLGRACVNQEWFLMSSMLRRCSLSATSSRVSRSLHSADTCVDPRAGDETLCYFVSMLPGVTGPRTSRLRAGHQKDGT